MRIEDKAGFVLVHKPTMQAFPDLKGGTSWWVPTTHYGERTMRIFETLDSARRAFHNWCRGGVTKSLHATQISRAELEASLRWLHREHGSRDPLVIWQEANSQTRTTQPNRFRMYDLDFATGDAQFRFKKPIYAKALQAEGWTKEERKAKIGEFQIFQVHLTCRNSFSISKSQQTF